MVLGLAFRFGHRAADVVATFALNIRPSNVFDGVQRPRNEHLFVGRLSEADAKRFCETQLRIFDVARATGSGLGSFAIRVVGACSASRGSALALTVRTPRLPTALGRQGFPIGVPAVRDAVTGKAMVFRAEQRRHLSGFMVLSSETSWPTPLKKGSEP